MRRAEVVLDQASQKLWFQAREGRPSATPSVVIKDSSGATVAAASTDYVTLDPVNTTVGAAGAAVGAKTVPLASVTGVRMGAEYRLKNALQQIEDVTVVGIDSTGTVYLDEQLEHAYALGDAFQSCEFYRTLQAAEVDALGELFIATATYAVTGAQTSPLLAPFDVVLHPLRGRNPLTVKALKRLWPDIAGQEWREQRGQDYAPQREEAWDKVCDALYTVSDPLNIYRRPAMVVSAENFLGWAVAELAIILQEGGISVIRNIAKEEALRRLDEHLTERKSHALAAITWYKSSGDESEARDEETDAKPLLTHFVA